ncbi:MAG: response regulator transcription factor [Roseivirga sp.]|nr:response regulator transcription factor [Roseivirga sp.]
MRCVVVDDEQLAVDVLIRYIVKLSSLELKAAFTNAVAAVDYLSQHRVDLLFLDINMPDLNGMQLLNSLEHKPMVIFTTAYDEYAVQSYDHSATDYLLKPITFDRFIKAVTKAQGQFTLKNVQSTNPSIAVQDKPEILQIKSGNSTHFISEDDICYIEGAGNYVTVFTEKEKIMSLMSMNKMEEMLNPDHFVRIHKSYIVAIVRIRKLDRASIMVGSTELPIGNTYRDRLFKALQK